VATAYELGWSTVTNGDLIRLAEQEGYELLITTDTNLRYQQNLRKRSMAILVLTTTSWPGIRQVTAEIQAAVAAMTAGGYREQPISRFSALQQPAQQRQTDDQPDPGVPKPGGSLGQPLQPGRQPITPMLQRQHSQQQQGQRDANGQHQLAQHRRLSAENTVSGQTRTAAKPVSHGQPSPPPCSAECPGGCARRGVALPRRGRPAQGPQPQGLHDLPAAGRAAELDLALFSGMGQAPNLFNVLSADLVVVMPEPPRQRPLRSRPAVP
jgi:hypothetical protein